MRSRHFRIYALSAFAFANFLHYATRTVFFHTAVYDDLRELYQFTDAELGLLGTTAFMVPHALATLWAGLIGDRFDRRRVLAVGVVLWSAATLFTLATTGFASIFATRVVAGLGCAACVPVGNAMLARLYEPGRRARAISIFNLGLFMGGVAGLFFGFALGFPIGFAAVAAPGLLLAVIVWRLPLPPEVVTGSERTRSAWADVRAGFFIPTLRRMYAGGILMAFAAGGYTAWFTDFLEKEKGMSSGESGVLLGGAMACGLAGVLAGGALADWWLARSEGGRQWTVATGFLCAVPCATLAIWLPTGPAFVVVSCLQMFFISWYHAPIAAAVDELVPGERAATTQGIYIFLMHLLGTAPSGALVGWFADDWGLSRALYVPTAAMALGGLCFLWSTRTVAADRAVVQPPTG